MHASKYLWQTYVISIVQTEGLHYKLVFASHQLNSASYNPH